MFKWITRLALLPNFFKERSWLFFAVLFFLSFLSCFTPGTLSGRYFLSLKLKNKRTIQRKEGKKQNKWSNNYLPLPILQWQLVTRHPKENLRCGPAAMWTLSLSLSLSLARTRNQTSEKFTHTHTKNTLRTSSPTLLVSYIPCRKRKKKRRKEFLLLLFFQVFIFSVESFFLFWLLIFPFFFLLQAASRNGYSRFMILKRKKNILLGYDFV